MSNVIPEDSRYLPIVQQKSSCVPACISMIMYKHRIPLIPQELLGYHLGLIVAPKTRSLFWNPRTGKRLPAGFGTQIANAKFVPNKVFPKLKIPLSSKFYPISKFDKRGFKEFLANTEKLDKDVMIILDKAILSGERKGKRGKHKGHALVFDRIRPEKNEVRVIDPSPEQAKWRVINLDKLKKAIDYHWPKSAGVWEFAVKK